MSQHRNGDGRSDQSGSSNPNRPKYMNVGTGSTSESAARLIAILDHDSDYGGALTDNDESITNLPAWSPTLTGNRLTPMASPGPLPFDQQSDVTSSHNPIQTLCMKYGTINARWRLEGQSTEWFKL